MHDISNWISKQQHHYCIHPCTTIFGFVCRYFKSSVIGRQKKLTWETALWLGCYCCWYWSLRLSRLDRKPWMMCSWSEVRCVVYSGSGSDGSDRFCGVAMRGSSSGWYEVDCSSQHPECCKIGAEGRCHWQWAGWKSFPRRVVRFKAQFYTFMEDHSTCTTLSTKDV